MLHKTKNPLLVVSILFLFLFSCSTNKQSFTKHDVKKAEKLIGLDFSKRDIDTLYPYLKRNRSGFDSLRKYPLENDVFPAVRFDPIPLVLKCQSNWMATTGPFPQMLKFRNGTTIWPFLPFHNWPL